MLPYPHCRYLRGLKHAGHHRLGHQPCRSWSPPYTNCSCFHKQTCGLIIIITHKKQLKTPSDLTSSSIPNILPWTAFMIHWAYVSWKDRSYRCPPVLWCFICIIGEGNVNRMLCPFSVHWRLSTTVAVQIITDHRVVATLRCLLNIASTFSWYPETWPSTPELCPQPAFPVLSGLAFPIVACKSSGQSNCTDLF